MKEENPTPRQTVPPFSALNSSNHRFDPGPPANDDGHESLDVWGFDDTRFHINEKGNVVLSGKRYLLSGVEMPDLMPWIRRKFDLPLPPLDLNPSNYPPVLPPSRLSDLQISELRKIVGDHLALDGESRLRRGHGHTQSEMYAIKYDTIERIPDAVVFPGKEDEVIQLVEWAKEKDFVLLPYGGGTNVSLALRCPPEENRPIISVDLRRMNRIRWIDPVNRLACIEAGAVGRHITTQLKQHGFTLGHEPDSVEFSTMGGWIATHASGMKKNRYGNIEDIVLDMRVATPQGMLGRNAVIPRESIGSDVRKIMFGSEGSMGIITEATVRLFPAPEMEVYASLLFPNLQKGVEFMYGLAQQGNVPASVRLVDNTQLQLNFVLKPKATGLAAVKSRIEKFLITRLLGFRPDEMVACTLVFEGRQDEVQEQQRRLQQLARRFGGRPGGSANGRRGYQLTYGIAYIRDFILNHWLLAESFETSVPWSQVLPLIEAVKKRITAEYTARSLPGKPFITARVTQIYPTGACIYFYFAFYYKGVSNPSETYHAIEEAARDEILKQGGSLSHHHGVGHLRTDFLPKIMTPASLTTRETLRRAIDPNRNIGTIH
jgi:alkyldihydroxyacetonephosphate synthase